MFDNIIAYSIKHKFVIGLFVVALIGIGTYSLRNLPIDALPDITNNQVQIITTTPNLSTQEVELYITYPIELAVKSIPDIIELRSISRFGLSLITIVFEESTDIYWARNQINERLKEAESKIPEGFGTPELAPISTGLGEIYQYTVSAKEGFEEEFDIMELRSVQDWIIVPQILGTVGVAEVNTLGGILKEYEVAVNPDKLKSMGITMAEIFVALEKNNENTGGAYIDKKPNAYFIRSVGMVSSLEDISKIVIKVNNNIPVLIRDVAEVNYGSTVRYGATTRNGHGEVVNGMVMMLKGENSAKVVAAVKERIEQIKTTLPNGVEINPYLDRSKLVDRAITTVETNLIEGALIVVFILVLLIGNWRAGLIVASVIPLSLLFAVSLMRFFGVSGNLMSLGAIDFGLIVDGAVIIVEAIVHRLQTRTSKIKLTSSQMDDEVYQAASGIRKSAAFGEIIILIVYLPILALVGIEGKMFTPMAQTVAFAIFGAFILSLTYIPMMSALFLSKKTEHKQNFSDKIIAAIQQLYTPVLNWALHFKKATIALAVVLFVVAMIIFDSLGGEFIPTLFEGDIATHVMIPPGSSLQQEIESTTKAEKLLMDNFPEIEQVVSKIGSAEVPTDPMPMEVADVMVIMKDKSEWTSASTKEEMFEKMEAVLDDLPGVTTEFSQPIQMRFNELMTGVRSDVGIKIYGEDIDRLVSLGEEVESIVSKVSGVEDARAETVSGLPQINIKYNKDKLALYGLNVSDLNQAVSMGFAGAPAGVIFEGEKMYDLVVRLAKPFRQDISNIKNLYVSLPSGNQIPLGQVADIRMEDGPAQISRENGKRRITVGFNVRDRDVESVVDEIHTKLDNLLSLPTGYYIEYTGQFENLKRAKNRLAIAVPLALALIFVLLFFTFSSISQSILIFTAIPLSAIGGVFALWLRDMPFSISAGIGFIALFGVAVLNGIVLIGYFNQLKKEGIEDIMERIKRGTSVRLRPVIMTAAVASFGFLPMALSTSAGAEVQKPLATVVIGGLITATMLTLVILPILYYYVEKFQNRRMKLNVNTVLILVLMSTTIMVNGQENQISSVDEAVKIALDKNGKVLASQYNVGQFEAMKNRGYVMPKADFNASFGQINTKYFDQSYSFSQRFNPFLIKASNTLVDKHILQSDQGVKLTKLDLVRNVKDAWDLLIFHFHEVQLLREQELLWERFSNYAGRKYEVGESNLLEKTTATNKLKHIQQSLKLKVTEIEAEKLVLQSLLNTNDPILIESETYLPFLLTMADEKTAINQHPLIQNKKLEVEVAQASSEVIKGELKPEILVGYFIHSIKGAQTINEREIVFDGLPRFQGVNLGLSLPVFAGNYKRKIKSQNQKVLQLNAEADQFDLTFRAEVEALKKSYYSHREYLSFFENESIPNGEMIASNASRSYESGDIGYVEYTQALETQFQIKKSYLEAIRMNNQLVIQLQFLLNQQENNNE